MDATFKLPPKHFWLGLFGLVFLLGILVLGTVALYAECPPGQPMAGVVAGLAALAFFALFTSPMILASVWLFLAGWYERLVIHGEEISFTGAFAKRRLALWEVIETRWRAVLPSVVLKTNSTRLTIHFGNYGAEQDRQLICFFRRSIPPEIQHGWDLFFVRYAKARARQARLTRKTEPGEGEVRLTRKRLDVYFLAGMLLGGAVAIWGFRVTGDARFLATPLVFVPIWLMLRFMHPRKGTVSRRITADAKGRFCLFAFLWLHGGAVCYILLKAFFPKALLAFLVPFFVISFVGIFIGAWVFDRRQRREEREAIEEVRGRGQLLPEELDEPWG